MKVHQLSAPPAPDLARALAAFEVPFTYPLGPGRSFRISHGEDYTLFFRAQGKGACFIAEDQGRVTGSLGTVVRRLWMTDGAERSVAYFGDLKIAMHARSGTVLVRLARAAEAWLRPQVEAAFSVVMGGTTPTPEAYTGRAGIPGFHDLGRVVVFRISRRDGIETKAANFLTDQETGLACYRRLSLGSYACPTSQATGRSGITPVWLMKPDGSACGMVEDTRRAKRLVTGDGSELLSAHLACFAYNAVPAGAELIGVALRQAVQLGLPALFVSVAEADAQWFCASLQHYEVLAAPAIVYGTGLIDGRWNINSSEI